MRSARRIPDFVGVAAAGVALAAGTAGLAHARAAAAPTVTLESRGTVSSGPGAVRSRPVEIFGSVQADGPAGDVVLEAKECETSFYRHAVALHTDANNVFHYSVAPPITTTYRARWGSATSRPLTIRARPGIRLRHVRGTLFAYEIVAFRHFVRARMSIQRFDRRTRTWVRTRRVTLGSGQVAGLSLWTTGQLRIRVPRGTLVRVVLPDAESGPCYAAGFSNLVGRR